MIVVNHISILVMAWILWTSYRSYMTTLMQYIVEETKDYLNSIVNFWPVTMNALL